MNQPQQSTAVSTSYLNLPPPTFKGGGFWVRVAALLIDMTFVSFLRIPLMMMVALALLIIGEDDIEKMIGVVEGFDHMFSAIAWGTYAGYFYSKRGATPGKLILRMQVVSSSSGARIGFWQGFFRDTIGRFLSAIFLFLGYIMAVFSSQRVCLHDLLFNTRVVRRNKT